MVLVSLVRVLPLYLLTSLTFLFPSSLQQPFFTSFTSLPSSLPSCIFMCQSACTFLRDSFPLLHPFSPHLPSSVLLCLVFIPQARTFAFPLNISYRLQALVKFSLPPLLQVHLFPFLISSSICSYFAFPSSLSPPFPVFPSISSPGKLRRLLREASMHPSAASPPDVNETSTLIKAA